MLQNLAEIRRISPRFWLIWAAVCFVKRGPKLSHAFSHQPSPKHYKIRAQTVATVASTTAVVKGAETQVWV